jgi:lipopolysaccharide export LptBFGC system permease protein LptF
MNQAAKGCFIFVALIVGLMLSMATVTTAAAVAPPAPQKVTATYNVYKAGLHIATDRETFERLGDTYKITSESTPIGALKFFVKDRIVIKSEGRITNAGLQPLRYEYSRNDPARNIRAAFDWSKREIRSLQGSKEETFDLPDNTQDRLSAMYQFMHAIPSTNSVTAWMSTGKKSERYVYLKKGEPTIKTNAGNFATISYARDAQAGESKAQIWLAKDRFHLPVRVVFEDKNGTFEQVLSKLAIE